jgi:hypothetical protein
MSRVTLPTLPANGNYVDAVQLDNIFNALLAGVNSVDNTQLATGAALANIGAQGITSTYLALANNLNQIGWYSVKDYGATGQGITDDSSAVQAAITAAAAAVGSFQTQSAGIYFPPGNYYLLTAFTFTVPVAFAPGATLVAAGTTIQTFNGPIVAQPTHIFATNNSTISINGATPMIFAEWFGAVGDGATNDTLAINNAIASGTGPGTGGGGANSPPVQLLAKTYYHATAITISRSGITLRGMGFGSTFLVSPTGVNGITILGTSGSYLQYVNVRDLSVQGVNATATSVGISVKYVNFSEVRDIRITYFQQGMYMNSTNALSINTVFSSPVTGSPTALYGFYIDGTGTVGNNSLNLTRCNANMVGATPTTGYGFYVAGNILTDCYFNMCESDAFHYCFYLNGASVTTYFGTDIHLLRCIGDSAITNAFWVGNWEVGAVVEIVGGWACADGAFGTNAVYFFGTYGASIVDATIFQVPQATGTNRGVYIYNSIACVASRNHIRHMQEHVYVTGSTQCSVDGNDIFNGSPGVTVSGTNAIHVTSGSNRNSVSFNTIGASAAAFTNGILLDTGCDYCNVIGNTIIPGQSSTTVNNNAANTHSSILGVIT